MRRLACYEVKALTKAPKVKGLYVADEFGSRRVDIVGDDELCLPAVVDDGRACGGTGGG